MDVRSSNTGLIGVGIYTVPQASRLSNVPPMRIKRWLKGRTREYNGRKVFDAPLWESSLEEVDGTLHLSFRDLIELRMVDRFRAQRLSMPYLRKVVSAARELLGDSHPFSTSRFKTDGKRLYLEVLKRTQEPELVEVLSGQMAFHSIISVGLKDVEFQDGVAALWRPESGRGDVVVDPERSFGQPILSDFGVPTSAIKLSASAGRTPREISRDFEISERAVKSAIAFEEKLAA